MGEARDLHGWGGSYDDDTGNTTVYTSESTNGGTSWSTPVDRSGAYKGNAPGTVATYDPVSGRYVIGWRSASDRLNTRVLPDGDVVEMEWPVGLLLRSADSFSIACGPAAQTGTDNCLIAWSHWNWDRFFYWGNAKVDTSGAKPVFNINGSTVYARGIVMVGTPSVAYRSTGTYPWEMTYHELGGTGGKSYRKQASVTLGWVDLGSYTNAGNLAIVNPALGSWNAQRTQQVDSFYTSTP